MPKVKKADQAIALYEKFQHLPKDKMVRVFIKELNLPSENSARTYISLSRKALASKLQIDYKARKIDSRTTKRGKAMELFNKNQQLSRREMISLFMKELNMSEDSAAVHCSQCSQEYTGPKHNSIV